MRIGELAESTGCQVETIRYYEKSGILPAPARSANNYRHYTVAHRRRLSFVRRCRELGFSLDEIRTLLAMIERGDYTCAQVEGLARDHLADIRARVADLRRLEAAMSDLVDQCSGAETPDCSLLETLFDDRRDASG